MKAKTTPVERPLSATEQLLSKREGCVAERDTLLSRLMEVNADIESLDSVIKMFDPNHVPLDIRRAQAAPVLTLSAQPILEEAAEQAASKPTSAAPPKDKRKNTKAAKADAKENAPKRKLGRPSKTEATQAVEPVKASTALSEAISGKVKGAKKTKQPKQMSERTLAAREQVKDYFSDIDKLKTLEDIVKSDSDGVPFRVICERFAERHPIDVSKPEVKKMFSDRISTLLYALSQQNVVQRGERDGADGKQENVWIFTRSRNGGGATAPAETSTAA